MALTREERETIIRRSDADDSWDVWCDPGVFRRLMERRGWRHTAEGEGFYRIPLDCVRIASARRKKRTQSAEQRQKSAERLLAARKMANSVAGASASGSVAKQPQ